MKLRLNKKITASFLITLLLLILPIFVYGEEIRTPQKATKRTALVYLRAPDLPATNFSVRLLVNPGGQAVNAVGLSLNFPTDKLEITSINTQNSFCELYVSNNFNNTTGEANIACGKPYPGISKTSEIITINFLTKTSGFAKITLADVQVLANDGYGTDVLRATSSKTMYIK